MNTYDIHIKNAEVIDGTGAPKFKSDVVVDKGKIIGVFPSNHDDVRDRVRETFSIKF